MLSRKNFFKELQIGDIILSEDENKRRIDWPLANIIYIYTGKDKVLQLAKVTTENGVFLLPVQRLSPLEIDTTDCTSSDNVIRGKLSSITFKSDNTKNVPEINRTKDSEEGVMPSGYSFTPFVITKTENVAKSPRRLQLEQNRT